MARDRKARNQSETSAETNAHSTSILNRRSYLKLAGTAAATVAATGAAGAVSAQKGYDTVVNMAEAGADSNGDEPIDDLLAEHANDDTLLKFPKGRYRVGEFTPSGLTNFAMRGQDATLVPTDGHQGYWIGVSGGSGFTFEGFTLDYSAEGTGPRVQFRPEDGLVVRNVKTKGLANGDQMGFRIDITSADGSGLIENLVSKNGAEPNTRREGMYISPDNKGTLTVRNCHIEGFANNGLYASASTGPVQVEGGTYKNNNIAQVRLGSDGSYAKGVTVVVDDVPSDEERGSRTWNTRGIRFREPGKMMAENCDIVYKETISGSPIQWEDEGGGATIRNTRIQIDADGVEAIRAKAPGGDHSGDMAVHLENVSITGEASGERAVLIAGRDGSTIENACIQQPGSGRNGVLLADASDCTIANSTINVAGTAVDLQGASAGTQNIQKGGTCPAPKLSGGNSRQASSGSGTESGNSENASQGNGGAKNESQGNETDDSGTETAAATATAAAGASASNASSDSASDSIDTSGSDDSSGNSDEKHALSVSGDGAGSTSKYEITVSGDLEKSAARSATRDDEDKVSGHSAEGAVAGGVDSYQFTGELTSLDVEGDATVYLDGEAVDPENYSGSGGDKRGRLVVDGQNEAGESRYSASVEGDLQPIDGPGTASGSTEGVANDSVDEYHFSGDLETLYLIGNGSVEYGSTGR